MALHDKSYHNKPKPHWIMSVRDLPPARGSARYRFTKSDGSHAEVILRNRKRQVVDALINKGPLFCASTVRIGDIVFRLKEDHDLYADTKTLANGRKYYALSGVTCLGPLAAEGTGGAK